MSTEPKKNKRQPNFTGEEVEVLIRGVERRSKLLFARFSSTLTSAVKEAGWAELTAEVNAVGGFGRGIEEVKKKWICVKSDAKCRPAAVKNEQKMTGGGMKVQDDVSSMENRVLGIVGKVSVHGIDSGYDSSERLLARQTGIVFYL